MFSNLEKILFFLTILFLPTQLGRHFWPDFSYIYSLRIDYLSPTLYFWDILVILLLGVWLIQKKKINLKALNLVLFFLLTQLFSLFTASNAGAGLVRVEQYILAFFFGLYIASQRWETLRQKIYLPLIISLSLESALAILQVVKSESLGFWILGERTFSITTPAIAKFNFYGIEVLRPYATFSHPNVLAAFLVIGGIFVYVLGDGFKRGTITFITFIAIILTFSRTAILAAIFSSIVYLRKKAIIWAAVLLIILSPLLFTRYSSIFSFDNLTILRREELTKSSIKLFLKNPLFGIGLNNFIPALSSEVIAGPNRFLQPVHNIFLLSLSETGIIGVIGLIGLIGWPIYKNFKYQISNIKFQMLLIWGTILFLGMFDHYFLTLPQGYRLLFMFWGISFSMLESNSESA